MTKLLKQIINTTLHGIDIWELKEWCNGHDKNDIDISDDGGEPPNDNDYDEPQPQNTNPIIAHPFTF